VLLVAVQGAATITPRTCRDHTSHTTNHRPWRARVVEKLEVFPSIILVEKPKEAPM